MSVDDWNSNDSLNTTLEGIPCGEGAMTIPSINDLLRKFAAAVKVFRTNAYCKDTSVHILPAASPAPTPSGDGDLWIQY